jgi:hypothetical protein
MLRICTDRFRTDSFKETAMIVIRNVFQLKFGRAKEAVALLREGVAAQKQAGVTFPQRILTDVSGPFYTVVLELTAPDLSTYEKEAPRVMGGKDFQAVYQKLIPLVESGRREIFTIVE